MDKQSIGAAAVDSCGAPNQGQSFRSNYLTVMAGSRSIHNKNQIKGQQNLF